MSELLKINVNEHTEKKNGLTYLSWAWAWAEVLKLDPQATWNVSLFPDDKGRPMPAMFLPDDSAMVGVKVTIKGDEKQCLLPVMNHRNQAIKGPDAFAINTAIMRCLAKAISMHGLGLYIYAGEDLPEQDEKAAESANDDKGHVTPTSGAGEGLAPDRKAIVEEVAQYLIEQHEAKLDMDAIEVWYSPETFQDNDERVYCWSLLKGYSKLRSTIKANKPEKKAA